MCTRDASHIGTRCGEGEGCGPADSSTSASEEDDFAVQGFRKLGGRDIKIGVVVSSDGGSRVSVEICHGGHLLNATS